jgi:histidine kinase
MAFLRLAGYDLQQELHQGVISLVYRGVRSSDGLRVIVKLLRNEFPTLLEIQRYEREYAIARGLDSASVVRPLAIERANHRLALVYEDTGSASLRQSFRGVALPVGRWLEVAIACTDALHNLHALGVLHKDVNPTNMLLEGNGRVRFIDFELAEAPGHQRQTEHSSMIGTYAYLSPEQSGRTHNRVDSRSDLYALGCTFYELATSQPVFNETDPAALIHAHLALSPRSPVDINPSISKTVSDIILKLLAKSPADRYQTAAGLLADLRRAYESWSDLRSVPSFALGTRDFSAQIRFSEALYNRDAQLNALLTAFHQTNNTPRSTWVALSGSAGSGKTSLTYRFASQLPARHLLCAGRCDRLQSGVPFSGIASALAPLMRSWLSRDAESLSKLRQKLLNALGANAGVISQVVPEFSQVLGKSMPPLPLGAAAAQTRFQLSFHTFFSVAAEDQSPLLLFLDDIQWADMASLQLLEQLLTGSPIGKLMLITAARHDESSPHFHNWQNKLLEKQTPVSQLELEPLDHTAVTALLSDSLLPYDEVSAPMVQFAQAVLEKTLGNPYFIRQFVQSLVSNGQLVYAEGTVGQWSVDLPAVQRIKLSDGILGLLTERTAKLDAKAQRALSQAACIGQHFDLGSLIAATDASIESGLDELRRNGFILQGTANEQGHSRYQFVHEGLRESAMAALASHDRELTHWRVGQYWLSQLKAGSSEIKLFDVVNQLNRGMSHAQDDATRWALLALDEQAAREARASAAFDASLEYASYAVSLMPSDAWEQHYPRALVLTLLLADAQASAGQLNAAAQVFQYAFDQAQGAFDQATCLDRLSDALQSSGKAAAALIEVRRALALLGQPLDLESPEIEAEQAAVIAYLCDPEILQRFSSLKAVSGEAALISSLYDKAIISVYFSAPQFLGLVAARSTQQVLNSGLTPQASIALAWWAMILCMQNKQPLAFAYASYAREIGAQFESDAYRGGSLMLAHAMSLCWQWPYTDNAKAAVESYERCHRSGNLQFASYGLIVHHISTCVESANVTAMLESGERWRDYCERYVPLELGQAKIRVHYLKRLMGQPAALNEAIDVDTILLDYEASGNATDVCESLVEMARVELIFDRFDLALQHTERAAPMFAAGAAGTLLLNLQHHVLLAVASARVAGQTEDADEVARLKTQMQASIDSVLQLTQYGEQNFFSYQQWVVAERARLNGDIDQAMGAYLRGAAHANVHGYWLLKAQLLQYCSELVERIGLSFASSLVAESQMFFRRAGAHAKVSQGLGLGSTTNTQDRTMAATSLNVEMSAVIKASDSIMGELDLSRLPARLLTLVMENTGAQMGVLALQRDDGLVVVADTSNGNLNEPLSSTGAQRCPSKLLNYVARALMPVVLDDGAIASAFAQDPYFASRRVRSVLCAPIMRQGMLRGVIYLENNAVSGVFNDSRLSVVTMLSGSAAVAIENAELYQTQKQYASELEQRVSERTKRLEEANTELARLANLDGLTQVANRRRFDTVLANRLNNKTPVWLIICDVDDFKRYNDQYGHQAGDDTLRRIAMAMAQAVLNPQALVARYGGEEFVVVLPDVDAEGARLVAESIARSIAALNIEHRMGRAIQRVSLSMGLAGANMLPNASQSDTAESLIRRADAALYSAKATGRNRLMVDLG